MAVPMGVNERRTGARDRGRSARPRTPHAPHPLCATCRHRGGVHRGGHSAVARRCARRPRPGCVRLGARPAAGMVARPDDRGVDHGWHHGRRRAAAVDGGGAVRPVAAVGHHCAARSSRWCCSPWSSRRARVSSGPGRPGSWMSGIFRARRSRAGRSPPRWWPAAWPCCCYAAASVRCSTARCARWFRWSRSRSGCPRSTWDATGSATYSPVGSWASCCSQWLSWSVTGGAVQPVRVGDPGRIALTADDGPHPEGTPAMLGALAELG